MNINLQNHQNTESKLIYSIPVPYGGPNFLKWLFSGDLKSCWFVYKNSYSKLEMFFKSSVSRSVDHELQDIGYLNYI